MDVVITYVDNKDKNWQDEFNKYNNKNIGSLAIDSVRFTPKDNLRYCLRSIAKNMPFVKVVVINILCVIILNLITLSLFM